MSRLVWLSTVAALAARATLQGQVSAGAPIPIPTRTMIGFNPLGLPADVATLEIENAVAQGVTVGGVGSYIDADHRRFTTLEFKIRYYPGDVVLRGWSVGASAGITRFSNIVDDSRQSFAAPTVGLIADYNWLLGRSEHFLIGTGGGVKRVLASDADRSRANVGFAVATARLILGVAF
ncbi:MAG TPA: hypothetical protein VHV78_11275 [Gemmatimonadaceae bacterium]|nr:hypothetical protein [Gemmatimonadaceae bacterium]